MDKKHFSAVILKYWYLIEFLGQVDFPIQNSESRDICKKALQGAAKNKNITVYHPLSNHMSSANSTFLSVDAELASDQKVYASYSVISDEIHLCIGKLERHIFAEKLQQAFRLDIELPEKNHNPICLLGLKCDALGKYIPHTLSVSPLVWGINRLLSHKEKLNKENMADFLSMEDYYSDILPMDAVLVETHETVTEGKILSEALLSNLVNTIRQKFLVNIMESEQAIGWDGMMIYRRYLSEDAKAQDNDILRDSELFNSFFADDLFLVERAVQNETFGDIPMEQAFLDYITGAYAEEKPELEWFDFSKRIDIYRQWNDGKAQQQSDFFHNHLDIAKAPLGKWPSKFMPCLMQQLAINMSWSPSCENAPIFSVNGPPGTGKTTLLKEIIAGNLVERAILLSEYADPDDAFVPQTFQDGDQSGRGYSKFCPKYFSFQDDRLKDYGIMVASCNNAAVENITKELPDGKALLSGLLSTNSEDPLISVGLDEVKSLFSTKDAPPESYVEWDDAEGKSVSKHYPDIYFTKLANDLAKKPVGSWDRWGLISAPFGKTSNLKSYIFSVLKPYIKSFGTNSRIASRKESYLEIVQQFRNCIHKGENVLK